MSFFMETWDIEIPYLTGGDWYRPTLLTGLESAVTAQPTIVFVVTNGAAYQTQLTKGADTVVHLQESYPTAL